MSGNTIAFFYISHFKMFFVKLQRTVILSLLVSALVACGTLVHHKVEKGETLYSIAFYYRQNYEDIAKWNHLHKPYVLNKGQWLRVAPPVKEWWEENGVSKQYAFKTRRKVNRPEKKNYYKQQSANKRAIVAKDFTDEAGSIRQWIWPTSGKLVDQGTSLPLSKNGINIEGELGQPIVATAKGKVVYSGSGLKGYGKLIIIKHNKHYLSAYAYNEKMLVREGDIVSQGQKIALMGRDIREKLDMLHFEIRKNGKPVNPLHLLAKRSH